MRSACAALGIWLATTTAWATDTAPLPWDAGGPFALIDHFGAQRSEIDPDGKHQLLFFGYATCPGICSAALPMIADVAEELEDRGGAITPVMITIDPKLDTLETMQPSLAEISDRLVGLTGSKEALQMAYDAFNVEFEHLFDDLVHGPIYAHTGFIFLLDPKGEVLTQIPPVLPTNQVTEIVAKYLELSG